MKINELNIDLSPRLKKKKFRPVSDWISRGIEAEIYPTKKSDIVVKKVTITSKLELNGYYQFLKVVKKNPNNPFFPRIYKARLFTDGSTYELIVTMEKLHPLSMKKIEDHVPFLLKQIGLSTKDVNDLMGEVITDIGDASVLFTEMIWSDNIFDSMKKRTKNPSFRKAIEALEPLMDIYATDLHFDNWMVRLTGVGPQLVITDPFAPD